MKNLLLLILLLTVASINAQIVSIPDPNFKNALLNYNPPIDLNNDNEIQVSEAENVTTLLSLSFENISDLTGIEAFVNLTQIRMQSNPITSVDLSANTLLTSFDAWNCPLNSINVSNNTLLETLVFTNGTVDNIDLSNNNALIILRCDNNDLSELDVSNMPSLSTLGCSGNNITTLDVTNNTQLMSLDCSSNNIMMFDFSNNSNIETLRIGNNPITEIDLSNNDNIFELHCDNTLISELDLSNMSSLGWMVSYNNPNLTYINLQNGNNDNYIVGEGPLEDLPNLQLVCIDDLTTTFAEDINQTGHPVTFTDDCPLTLNNINAITGNIRFDLMNDGCDPNDVADIAVGNTMIISNNESGNYQTFTQNDGSYTLYVGEGDFSTSVTTNLPDYFDVSPESEVTSFTGFGNTDTTDFCVSSSQTINDLYVTLIPVTAARPGFMAEYQVLIKNKGTTILSGGVEIEFDNDKLQVTNLPTSGNTILFQFFNLAPFSTLTATIECNVFAPPTVNIGDVLNFTTTVTPIEGDHTVEDNTFNLEQTVRGSFDPNDITVLEGDEILYEDIDKYLHYVIRFQNTGTDFAENVVVNNVLDSNLDWNTIELLNMSHFGRVEITNDNNIDFIFEDINLPAESQNEALSNGFIAYKIKPRGDINIGDIMNNVVDIYFDFNEPIQTNTVSTEVVDALSLNEYHQDLFSLFPNPTSDIIYIESQFEISTIDIYNSLGQLVLSKSHENRIDISNFSNGFYLVQITAVDGQISIQNVLKK